MCPFTQKDCSKECDLYQQRKEIKYSGCALNLIADYAVAETIKKDVERKALENVQRYPINR
jgi:hypothetical protein